MKKAISRGYCKGQPLEEITSTVVTPVKLDSHCNVAAISLGVESNKLGSDWWSEFVLHDRVPIVVSAKQLKERKKKDNK